MSIRFKFRSSVAFDSVDLGGRRSISVGDLRAKIIAQKKLQICKDFDLVIADAETGTAFGNDEIQINEGSSVVIKRVPAGLSEARGLNVGNFVRQDGGHADRIAPRPSENVDKENFDDFGVDLYPVLQGSLPELDADIDNLNFTANRKNDVVPRLSETSVSRGQNIGGSDLSEAMSKEGIGDNCCKKYDNEEIGKQMKLQSQKELHKLDEYIGLPSSAMLNMDLPTELRCSLCNEIFKEAVMIPCCQHSFCEKCIRLALVERGRCPKCSSTKCSVGALLPNLSLRQAIEHFLEAQAATNAIENKIPQYAPDVESGIHVKEQSYAVSVRQNEPPCPHSPSATGRGSNQVMVPAYENKLTGVAGRSAPLRVKINQMEGGNSSSEARRHVPSFNGVHNSSNLPQNFLQAEANAPMNMNKGYTGPDGSGNFMPHNRLRKGGRTCYMCGSPDHLIRDCPAASNPYSFDQTGDTAYNGGVPIYGQAYWHETTFPQARPYMNMYGAPGVVPFNPTMGPTMGPVSPFSVTPYMSPMYNGMPGSYGFMRTEGMQRTMVTGAERRLPRQVFMEPHDGESKQKSASERSERDHGFDDMPEAHHYKGSQRTFNAERRQLPEKATSRSLSGDDSPRIRKRPRDDKDKYYGSPRRPAAQSHEERNNSIERRHGKSSHQSNSGRDQRRCHPEKSSSVVYDSYSDSSNHHSRERKKHHHANLYKKPSERRGQPETDIVQRSQHRSRKEMSDDEKVVKDHKKHGHKHHHDQLDSSLERNFPIDRRAHNKEKEVGHTSRPSREMRTSKDDQSEHERWEMADGYGGGKYKHRRIQ